MTSDVDSVKADWAHRIGRRTGGGDGASTDAGLAPPHDLCASSGRGQVTLTWTPVAGAVGYLVHRADHAQGSFEVVDHGGNDVLAVPHGPYVDTSAAPGRSWWYAVAALSAPGRAGPRSEPVVAAPEQHGGDAVVRLQVDASSEGGTLARPWRPMIGSEHLSLLLSGDQVGGRRLGAGLRAALQRAHDDLGVSAVRAHAILGDDLGVYREVDGEPVHDFTGVDRVFDLLLGTGMRPVVEISFMPEDLASDPTRTVFAYRAGISPPKDWSRWAALVTSLVAHLVDRYGLEEVRDRWSFEVWNEANLDVFWSGTEAEFLRLYDVTAAAVRAVDDALVVGGPSSAAAQQVDLLLQHTARSGAALDFVSTHTYGSPPLDLRPVLRRYGRADARIWWTEWGPGSQHFHPVGDTVFAATFLLDGMVSSMGRVDALSHWVVSDHFEELGRPARLAHGGFGLLTIGNLRKPRWWALAMLERLGDSRLDVDLDGDGAGSLVKAVAARHDDGRVGLLVWNGTLDQSKLEGEPMLGRTVVASLAGLEPGRHELRHWRVDAEHSNIFAAWSRLSGDARDWPQEGEWEALRETDGLDELEPARTIDIDGGGTAELTFALPQPGISLVEVTHLPPT